MSIALFLPLPSHAQDFPCMVTKITDGDTFHCISEGVDTIVRLIGCDTPEMPTPEGKAAKAFTAKLIPVGTVVRLELDIQPLDYFHRTLAYVYLPDGRMLNEVLLQGDVAVLLTVPPNVKYVSKFKELSKY